MTCKDALALSRRGARDRAADHLATCAACRGALAAEDRALDVARAALAIEPPPGDADRVARAALAAGPPRATAWWEVAFPIAWRAALAIDLVGAGVLMWHLARAPGTPPGRGERGVTAVDVDAVLDREADAVLTRALGLTSPEEAP